MVSRPLNRVDVEDIVVGATLLGAGGGGPPYIGKILGLQALEYGKVRLIEPSEVKDDANAIVSFGMGSPVAHNEKWLDIQLIRAIDALEKYLRRRMDIVVAFEQGGGNTPAAMYTAANKQIPLFDGDGIGRAVPELQMTMFDLNKISISPMVLADPESRVTILEVDSAYTAERLSRAITVEYGFLAGGVAYPMTGRELKRAAVPMTMTLARRIGRALRRAGEEGEDYSEAVLKIVKGRLLIRGEISDVSSKTVKGFDFGVTEIRGEGEYSGSSLRIDFKNENIIAWLNEKPVAMVPDLICVVDDLTGQPLTNVDVRRGLKVFVTAIPAHPKVRTSKGFEMFRHVLKLLNYEGEFIHLEKAS